MNILVQIPVVDLRSIVPDSGGRMARPGWPVGRVDVARGHSEFVRGFGELRDTARAETGGWAGRAQHVQAKRALILPAELQYVFDRSNAHPGLRAHGMLTTCKGRAYYGSSTSVRAFLQMQLSLTHPARRGALESDELTALVESAAQLPVRVGADGRVTPLYAAGPAVSGYIRRNTTKPGYLSPNTSYLVSPGRLMVVVACHRRAIPDLPKEFHILDAGLAYKSDPRYECWIVRERQDAGGRCGATTNLSLQLTRLHSERVSLTTLARHLGTGTVEIREGAHDSDAVQRALRAATNYLKRPTAFGNEQAALLRAIDSDLSMNEAQWAALQETLSIIRPQVAEEVVTVLNVIQGDQVMGDKFSNISNSNIANRAVVIDAFNVLATQPEDDDLRTALLELVEKAESLDDAETSSLVERIVEEAAGPRDPHVLDALWRRLKEVAPVLGALTAVGTAIARIAGG